jgi:hypothetical protein
MLLGKNKKRLSFLSFEFPTKVSSLANKIEREEMEKNNRKSKYFIKKNCSPKISIGEQLNE